MRIKTQIYFKQYLRLQYLLTYRKFYVILSSVCGIIMLLSSILELSGVIPKNDNLYIGLIFGAYITMIPFLIYRGAKKNFETHKTLQDEIQYEFLPDKFIITTPYSTGELPWEKIYKIKEFKDWFLIYQSNRIANLIPKNSLTKEEVFGIKEVLKEVKGLKTKLKSN